MKTRVAAAALLTLAVTGTAVARAAAAGTHDLYGLARYPVGGRLKPGVELYEAKEGGGPADRYTRLVVRWWRWQGTCGAPD